MIWATAPAAAWRTRSTTVALRRHRGTTTSAGLVAGSPSARTSLGSGGSAPHPAPISRETAASSTRPPSVAGDVQFNLDFAEPPRRVLVVRHRHRVVDHLGQELPVDASDLDRAPDGGEAGHRLEGQSPGGGEHQVGGRLGNLIDRAFEADLPADQIRPLSSSGSFTVQGGRTRRRGGGR